MFSRQENSQGQERVHQRWVIAADCFETRGIGAGNDDALCYARVHEFVAIYYLEQMFSIKTDFNKFHRPCLADVCGRACRSPKTGCGPGNVGYSSITGIAHRGHLATGTN